MPIEGVDYSFSRPTPAQLKQAGKRFAVRYVGTTSSGKNLTRPEADALRAAGIELVANYEGRVAGWMSGGRRAGIDAARAAHDDAVSCGMPPDRPVYFSADYNATFDQYKTQVKPCLQGAASVLGVGRVGIYGGIFPVTWAHEDGIAPWMWQTYAWSFGQWYPKAQLRQYHNGVTLGSGVVDLCRAMTPEYGQWGHQTPEEDLSIVDAATQKYFDDKFDAERERLDRLALWIAGRANAAYSPQAIASRLGMDKVDFDTPLSPAALKQAFTSVMDKLATGGVDAATVAALVAGQLEIKGLKASAGGEITITFGPPTT